MPLLLSLCFPTYNRAPLLDGALRAALQQVTPAMHGQVEVVVLDNASPDDTPDVVAKAQQDFPHVTLRPVRRPHNIGPDANFCDAPNQAQGQFVYLLSDDDVLLPGAVPTLLALIQEHPGLDAFALNVRGFHDDPYQESDAPLAYTLTADRLLPGRDEALGLLKMHITFLSCIAFRRENVLGRDYAPRFSTNLAQAYMFLDALAPGRGMYAAQQPYLARREDNNEGFDFFRVFVTHLADLMEYARVGGYRAETVRQVLEHHLAFIYHFVLVFKSSGGYGKLTLSYPASLTAILRLLRVYKLNRFLLLMIIPRLLVPSAVFVRLQRLYVGLKARRAGTDPKRDGGRSKQPPRQV